MEIPGVSFKKEVRKEIYPGLIQIKSCMRSFHRFCFGFWHWNFQGVSHNFVEFPGMKFCFFLGVSKGKKTNVKIPGVFLLLTTLVTLNSPFSISGLLVATILGIIISSYLQEKPWLGTFLSNFLCVKGSLHQLSSSVFIMV